jgi:tRNA(fMet)-specific endonuclease VapC
VAVVTVDEQLRGWYTVVRNAKGRAELARAYENLAKSIAFLSRTNILPFAVGAIERFERLKRAKLGIAAPDLRLAATALECNAVVVTRNVRDFSGVPGLRVEDWSH